MEFLSTPSARRATCIPAARRMWQRYFYPRPPRGGRRPARRCHHVDRPISIHALREEGDEAECGSKTPEEYFYPRPPRGGRPASLSYLPPAIKISIHALREEGDRRTAQAGSKRPYFYPRPPRGGRPAHPDVFVDDPEFLSTPSARRATQFARTGELHQLDFYPRPPRGGRP